jgi:hypothetical protein
LPLKDEEGLYFTSNKPNWWKEYVFQDNRFEDHVLDVSFKKTDFLGKKEARRILKENTLDSVFNTIHLRGQLSVLGWKYKPEQRAKKIQKRIDLAKKGIYQNSSKKRYRIMVAAGKRNHSYSLDEYLTVWSIKLP